MRILAVLMGIGLFGVQPAWPVSEAPVSSRPDVPIDNDDDGILLTLQKQALPDLIRSLTPQKPSKGLRLIGVYGGIHDSRANLYLLQGYRQAPSEGIRCKILESMGKLRDPSLFGFFVDKLDDAHIPIQCYAIWALGELQSPLAIKVLRAKLASPNEFVQLTVIDALGKTGQDPDVAYALIVFLHDADIQRRYLAAKALKGAGGPANVGELFSVLQDERSLDIQEALASTLGTIGGVEAVTRFIDLLKSSPSPDKEHWVGAGMMSADPSLVIAALKPLLEGSDIVLKISALKILGQLDVAPATVHAAALYQLRAWSRSKDPELNRIAGQQLVKIEPDPAKNRP